MEKIDIHSIDNLTIWVGAGISMSGPTYLPSGNDLTQYVFNTVILSSDRLLEVWNQINKYEKKYIDTNPFPRLELILSSIAYVEKYFKNGHFISGFDSFNQAPFNQNHIFLAALVHEGATIMTANFDLEIEKAYNYIYMGQNFNSSDIDTTLPGSKGRIIHFHGTCHDGNRMGATIENITHLVNKQLYSRILRCFKKDRRNVFLGYSFSDVYDINVTISEIYTKNSKYSTRDNWICSHSIKHENRGCDKKLENRAKSIFGDNSVNIFSYDSTSVLNEICKEYKIPVLENTIDVPVSEELFDWRDAFKDKIQITEEFKVLSTIHLLNRMAIAVDKINVGILDKYEKMRFENDKKMIFEFHLSTNSKYWYEKYKDMRLNDFYSIKLRERIMEIAFGSLVEKQYHGIDFDDVIEMINKKKFVFYDEFSILTKQINDLKLYLIKNRAAKDITAIKKLLLAFLSFPIGKFIEIVLYASMYRYMMLINGIENKDIDTYFNIANSIYYDIGNVDGIISSMLDKYISQYYLLSSYEWEQIVKSDEWKNLRSLCDIVGTYRYKTVLDFIAAERTKVL